MESPWSRQKWQQNTFIESPKHLNFSRWEKRRELELKNSGERWKGCGNCSGTFNAGASCREKKRKTTTSAIVPAHSKLAGCPITKAKNGCGQPPLQIGGEGDLIGVKKAGEKKCASEGWEQAWEEGEQTDPESEEIEEKLSYEKAEVKRKEGNVEIRTGAWKRDPPTLVYWLVFLDDGTCATSSKTRFGFKEGPPESWR